MYVQVLRKCHTVVNEKFLLKNDASKSINFQLSYLIFGSFFAIYFQTAHKRIGNVLSFLMMYNMSN